MTTVAATACVAAPCLRLLPRLLPQVVAPAAFRQPIAAAGLLLRLQQLPQRPAAANGAAAPASRGVRCYSSSSGGEGAGQPAPSEKKRVVFCGTPEVAALVLKQLLHAASQPDATFEVSAVVTQPGRPRGRGNRKVPQPSAVEQAAVESGLFTPDRILSPEKPGDKQFLAALQALQPDLCVTAAYGNYLPSSFLALPRHGTLNIHPSLLPLYRGAAPVQRSLQDGVPITGVTVLYTVREMDAGPILAQKKLPVDPEVQAPELLDRLFELGTQLLVDNLEVVWAGLGDSIAQPQDHSAATHAPKLQREEAVLDFSQPALVCHNKVRGFAGWPGTFATFRLVDESAAAAVAVADQATSSSSSHGSEQQQQQQAADDALELKIVRTRVVDPSAWSGSSERVVTATRDALYIRCADGSVLQVLELQAPGKRVMAARDFVNGLKGRTLVWQPVQQPASVGAAA